MCIRDRASTAGHPELIFDYSGFPPHTYQLTWPAPGDPDLAQRAAQLLKKAGLPSALDAHRGFDHGVFVPLKVAFPHAEIPVVPLSLAVDVYKRQGYDDGSTHEAARRPVHHLQEHRLQLQFEERFRRFFKFFAQRDSACLR